MIRLNKVAEGQKKLEESMLRDIGTRRFIPYIQLHEYEALILSEPGKLATFFLEHQQGIDDLTKVGYPLDSGDYKLLWFIPDGDLFESSDFPCHQRLYRQSFESISLIVDKNATPTGLGT